MSTEQIRLDELNRPVLTVEQERMAEFIESRAQAPRRTECRGCGHHVSVEFVRSLGNNGKVYACPHCVTLSALKDGAAMNPDYQARCGNKAANGSYRGDGR